MISVLDASIRAHSGWWLWRVCLFITSLGASFYRSVFPRICVLYHSTSISRPTRGVVVGL